MVWVVVAGGGALVVAAVELATVDVFGWVVGALAPDRVVDVEGAAGDVPLPLPCPAFPVPPAAVVDPLVAGDDEAWPAPEPIDTPTPAGVLDPEVPGPVMLADDRPVLDGRPVGEADVPDGWVAVEPAPDVGPEPAVCWTSPGFRSVVGTLSVGAPVPDGAGRRFPAGRGGTVTTTRADEVPPIAGLAPADEAALEALVEDTAVVGTRRASPSVTRAQPATSNTTAVTSGVIVAPDVRERHRGRGERRGCTA